MDTNALAAAIKAQDRGALAKAITLVESTREDHRAQGAALIQLLHGSGQSVRVGITGAPGVGKSTFIEALGGHLIDQGHKVAVLAVDPSSALRGGSILGDKTRMSSLAQNPQAFIRPSASGATLGGIARRSAEAARLCEAAGFDIVLIETVGVGQSETAVAAITDVFILLLLPGGGDDLQGIKRGIMELADLILVNKADGQTQIGAEQTAADYRSALAFMPQKRDYWSPCVHAISAQHNRASVAESWQQVQRLVNAAKQNGDLEARRLEQASAALQEAIRDGIEHWLSQSAALEALSAEVRSGKTTVTAAAQSLLSRLRSE